MRTLKELLGLQQTRSGRGEHKEPAMSITGITTQEAAPRGDGASGPASGPAASVILDTARRAAAPAPAPAPVQAPRQAADAPATLAELRGEFGDGPFTLACLDQGLTMQQAYQARLRQLSQENERIRAEAAAAAARSASIAQAALEVGGAPEIPPSAPAGQAAAAPGAAWRTFEEAVAHYQSAAGGGLSPFRATREAAVRHPELHARYLAQRAERLAHIRRERARGNYGAGRLA